MHQREGEQLIPGSIRLYATDTANSNALYSNCIRFDPIVWNKQQSESQTEKYVERNGLMD